MPSGLPDTQSLGWPTVIQFDGHAIAHDTPKGSQLPLSRSRQHRERPVMNRYSRVVYSVTLALGLTAAAGGMAPASAALNDLVVKNGGSRDFLVCSSARNSTECGGTVGVLSPGQNTRTKFGWADTDMIDINANCKLYQWAYSGGQMKWVLSAIAGSTSRWMKVPGNNGNTITYKVTC